MTKTILVAIGRIGSYVSKQDGRQNGYTKFNVATVTGKTAQQRRLTGV